MIVRLIAINTLYDHHHITYTTKTRSACIIWGIKVNVQSMKAIYLIQYYGHRSMHHHVAADAFTLLRKRSKLRYATTASVCMCKFSVGCYRHDIQYLWRLTSIPACLEWCNRTRPKHLLMCVCVFFLCSRQLWIDNATATAAFHWKSIKSTFPTVCHEHVVCVCFFFVANLEGAARRICGSTATPGHWIALSVIHEAWNDVQKCVLHSTKPFPKQLPVCVAKHRNDCGRGIRMRRTN